MGGLGNIDEFPFEDGSDVPREGIPPQDEGPEFPFEGRGQVNEE